MIHGDGVEMLGGAVGVVLVDDVGGPVAVEMMKADDVDAEAREAIGDLFGAGAAGEGGVCRHIYAPESGGGAVLEYKIVAFDFNKPVSASGNIIAGGVFVEEGEVDGGAELGDGIGEPIWLDVLPGDVVGQRCCGEREQESDEDFRTLCYFGKSHNSSMHGTVCWSAWW